jgi:hypothetical protein
MAAEEGKKKVPAKKAAPKDRTALKTKLKDLKKKREEARGAHDAAQLERIRRRYRRVTHALRRLAPPKPKAVKAE